MELKALTHRALEIKDQYAEREKKKNGRAWSASEITLGFVGDVGDVAKLVLAKEGVRDIADVDTKMAHELSDCLWSILVLAHTYGVDLEGSFMKTMDELEEKIAVE